MCRTGQLRGFFLAIAFALLAVDNAGAKVPSPESAIISADIAVVGALSSVQRGTFSDPNSRFGELAVLEVLKGSPPSQHFRISLPDNWGPPGLTAGIGRPSFWILFFVSIGIVLAAVHIWSRRRRREAVVATIALTVIWLFLATVLGATFFARVGIEDWPRSPDDLLGTPSLWVISKHPNGEFSAHPYRLQTVTPYLEKLDADRERIDAFNPDAQEAMLKLKRYLESTKP